MSQEQATADEIDDLKEQNAKLREALRLMYDSAYPHPIEHPTMFAAWKVAKALLAEQPASAQQGGGE